MEDVGNLCRTHTPGYNQKQKTAISSSDENKKIKKKTKHTRKQNQATHASEKETNDVEQNSNDELVSNNKRTDEDTGTINTRRLPTRRATVREDES